MKHIILIVLISLGSLNAQEVMISEKFENGIPDDWEVKTTESKRNWYAKSYKGTHYLSMSGFGGKGKPGYKVSASLYTPLLALGDKSCKLRFSFADAYSNGQPLKVYLTGEEFQLIKKIDDRYWEDLVNNKDKYDNAYEATPWIALPKLSQPYRVSLVYDSENGDNIITTIIQLNEFDVWCEE
ncbi:hypothetical protein GO491_07925 [Flavobacteriaceae bacterium Ap0902]|nr:hypothetical protein [Flavobacteriaceae bacterium Ap0902]